MKGMLLKALALTLLVPAASVVAMDVKQAVETPAWYTRAYEASKDVMSTGYEATKGAMSTAWEKTKSGSTSAYNWVCENPKYTAGIAAATVAAAAAGYGLYRYLRPANPNVKSVKPAATQSFDVAAFNHDIELLGNVKSAMHACVKAGKQYTSDDVKKFKVLPSFVYQNQAGLLHARLTSKPTVVKGKTEDHGHITTLNLTIAQKNDDLQERLATFNTFVDNAVKVLKAEVSKIEAAAAQKAAAAKAQEVKAQADAKVATAAAQKVAAANTNSTAKGWSSYLPTMNLRNCGIAASIVALAGAGYLGYSYWPTITSAAKTALAYVGIGAAGEAGKQLVSAQVAPAAAVAASATQVVDTSSAK